MVTQASGWAACSQSCPVLLMKCLLLCSACANKAVLPSLPWVSALVTHSFIYIQAQPGDHVKALLPPIQSWRIEGNNLI